MAPLSLLTPSRHPLALATVVATAGTVLLGLAARGAGDDLVVDRGGTLVGASLGAVATATLAGGLAAAVLRSLSGRAGHPRRIYLALTAVGLLVSFVPPLLVATTPATTVWLLGMHAVAAAVIMPAGLPRLVGPGRPA